MKLTPVHFDSPRMIAHHNPPAIHLLHQHRKMPLDRLLAVGEFEVEAADDVISRIAQPGEVHFVKVQLAHFTGREVFEIMLPDIFITVGETAA